MFDNWGVLTQTELINLFANNFFDVAIPQAYLHMITSE